MPEVDYYLNLPGQCSRDESELSVTVHESPHNLMQKLLSHPMPSTEHNSHWTWQRGGGITAKKHFVVINVSKSVSKAFLKSLVASNGGLAHWDPHLSASQTAGTGPLVLGCRPHTQTHTYWAHVGCEVGCEVGLRTCVIIRNSHRVKSWLSVCSVTGVINRMLC